ncbi:MAG: hypothetical protein LQ352_007626 [Teloschistes flavicans]|nr:MAG: hypothetical protein LQ352_007626 [Teloschistes flavicans]
MTKIVLYPGHGLSDKGTPNHTSNTKPTVNYKEALGKKANPDKFPKQDKPDASPTKILNSHKLEQPWWRFSIRSIDAFTTYFNLLTFVCSIQQLFPYIFHHGNEIENPFLKYLLVWIAGLVWAGYVYILKLPDGVVQQYFQHLQGRWLHSSKTKEVLGETPAGSSSNIARIRNLRQTLSSHVLHQHTTPMLCMVFVWTSLQMMRALEFIYDPDHENLHYGSFLNVSTFLQLLWIFIKIRDTKFRFLHPIDGIQKALKGVRRGTHVFKATTAFVVIIELPLNILAYYGHVWLRGTSSTQLFKMPTKVLLRDPLLYIYIAMTYLEAFLLKRGSFDFFIKDNKHRKPGNFAPQLSKQDSFALPRKEKKDHSTKRSNPNKAIQDLNRKIELRVAGYTDCSCGGLVLHGEQGVVDHQCFHGGNLCEMWGCRHLK